MDADVEAAEEEFLYDPAKGNVAFISAVDNWGFTLNSLCPRIAKSLGGMNPKALQKFMWGKFYYKTTEKKIVKEPPRYDSCEMFVQYAMKPLFAEYRKIFTEEMLGDTVLLRESHKKIKTKLFELFPIHKAVLGMVCRQLPSPLQGQPRKIDCLAADFKSKTRMYMPVRDAIINCNKDEPIIVYVTKMQPFSSRIYNLVTRQNAQNASPQQLIAIARVYSGTLRAGSRVFVFGANHSTETPDVTEVEIPHLFLLMGGQGLEAVN